MLIRARIEKLETGFAAEGDLGRARRAALARAEITEEAYDVNRDEHRARGEVLYSCDRRLYLIATGVSRNPDDPPTRSCTGAER
jgi:hypothetical protein